MKKLCILFAAFILSIAFAACKNEKPAEDDLSKISRFVVVESNSLDGYKIFVDKKTYVMYAVSTGGYNRGDFTLLVNQDGKPLIWEGADE